MEARGYKAVKKPGPKFGQYKLKKKGKLYIA